MTNTNQKILDLLESPKSVGFARWGCGLGKDATLDALEDAVEAAQGDLAKAREGASGMVKEMLAKRLDALGGNRYAIMHAYASVGGGVDPEILDCYEDQIEFVAADDEEALKHSEELQNAADAKAAAIIETSEGGDKGSLERSFSYAPNYSSCLVRLDENDEEYPVEM